MRFKNLEGKPERENPKRTISTSGRLGPLQMISEPHIGRCANEETEPRGGDKLGGPTSIGERNECHRGYWTPKEGGL